MTSHTDKYLKKQNIAKISIQKENLKSSQTDFGLKKP